MDCPLGVVEMITNSSTNDSFIPHAAGERYVLLAWTCACVIISIPGNITVLAAVLVYNAIKLDRVSVILICNLAVWDLIYTTIGILPTIPALATEKWVFGTGLCCFQYWVIWLALLGDVTLVCSLNISKLTSLLFPLDARLRARRTGRYIALCLWLGILLFSVPVALNAVRGEIRMNSGSYRCDSSSGHSASLWWVPVYSVLFIIIPILLIIVTTVWLLWYVNKERGLQRQSILTLILISGVFVLSYISVAAMLICYIFVDPGDPENTSFYDHFFKVSMFINYVNYTLNPLVYYRSISSFNRFVKTKVFRVRPQITPQFSSTTSTNFRMKNSVRVPGPDRPVAVFYRNSG